MKSRATCSSVLGGLLALFAATLTPLTAADAGEITVKFSEGVTRAFPALRNLDGERIAHGDFVQVERGGRVESRMTFRFADGSFYDETAVFSQNDVFTLLSYRLIQRGPSFPETVEAWVDRASGRYEVRYRGDDDSAEQRLAGKITLPADVYNGMLSLVLKNLAPGLGETVQIVAFTPNPRLVTLQLQPVAEDVMEVSEESHRAVRYIIRPQLGLFASLLVSDVPDVKVWILGGEAPAFMKAEGPLYFMGPIWRIEPY